jgi:hypothetical protein
MRCRSLRLVLVAGLALSGCGAKPEGPAARRAALPKIPDQDAPPAYPENKDVYLDRLKIGKESAPDGTALEETGGQFRSGSQVYVSFVLRNAPAGSEVKAVWTTMPDHKPIGEEVQKVGAKGFAHFHLKPPSDGVYRLEKSFRGNPGDPWMVLGHNEIALGPTGK